jgi:proteasome lid subunit RPN8/RPN11
MALSPISSATIAPLVVENVIDHFSRREETVTGAFGVLLGSFVGSSVDVRMSMPIHHTEALKDGNLIVHLEFTDSHRALYLQTCRKDSVVGWYSTSPQLPALHDVVTERFFPKDRYKATIHLLHLVVDPSTVTSQAGISVRPYTYTEAVPLYGAIARQVPFSYAMSDIDRVATAALVSQSCPELVKAAPRLAALGDSRFSEGDSLPDATPVSLAIQALEPLAKYVSAVADGTQAADPAVARGIMEALNELPRATEGLVEGPIGDAVQALLAVHFVAKMAATHSALAESLHRDRTQTTTLSAQD